MNLYLSTICLLLIIYVSFVPAESHNFTTSYGQVGISYLSDKKFRGSFISDTGVEVTFATEWNHNFEYTTIGSPTSGTIVSSYYIDYPYRLLRAQNTWILNNFISGYSVEAGFLSHLTEEQLPKENRRQLYEASARFVSSIGDRAMTSSSSQAEWSNIVYQEEMQLLPAFSFGLAELGYTGANYPILQKFHKIASRIYPHLSHAIEPAAFAWCSSSSKCKDEYNMPIMERECLGMCGRGCSCWCWVCGDCCFYQGCYEHDLCCRKNGYGFGCWFPYNFACNSFAQEC